MHIVATHQPKLGGSSYHRCHAVHIGKEYPFIGGDHRGLVVSTEALHPTDLASAGLKAASRPVASDRINIVAVNHGRGHVGINAPGSPQGGSRKAILVLL